jgi:hypothetical protein
MPDPEGTVSRSSTRYFLLYLVHSHEPSKIKTAKHINSGFSIVGVFLLASVVAGVVLLVSPVEGGSSEYFSSTMVSSWQQKHLNGPLLVRGKCP